MSKKIIFVDDERPILRAIRRLFMSEPFECSFFDNGTEALAHMEANGAPDLLMTDMRMPGIDGLSLLKEVKYRYPSTIRVILSGYTDSKVILNALEENLSQFFMHKPWKNEELLKVIHRLLDMRELMMSEHLHLKMEEIGNLPTLPSLYRRITGMIRDEAPVDGIVATINEDFVIAGNILHVANAAFYGSNASNIKQAVMMIGLVNVQQIIIATEVFKDNSDELKQLALWEHAFLTNNIATYVYEKHFAKKMPMNASSAGMLHNIGIILLMTKFSDAYTDIIAMKQAAPERDIIELEREVLQTDHLEMGGFLMNWWEMPLPVIEGALYYRRPEEDSCLNYDVVKSVHIASHVAWKILGKDLLNFPLDEAISRSMGYDEEKLTELIKNFTKI